MSRLYFTAVLLSIASYVLAQTRVNPVPKKIYTTKAMSGESPRIDGRLDDQAWDQIDWGGDFVESKPANGTAPSHDTRFKILYDAKNLYIGIRAYDSDPDLIIKRLSRRDGFVGDRFNILIDSYHDLRTGFLFTVTAAGVRGDEFVSSNGDNLDDSWNPIWYAAANVDEQGWTAEMKIPFSQLRFSNAEEQIWGLNILRNYLRENEEFMWQNIPPDIKGFVSESGELHGIKGIKPQRQLEVQPFVVGQYDSYPQEGANPFRDGSDAKINAGIDAKIGVTNDLTLDLTINPDFGQVDADPGAIALDGFQIFFQERRPFFVENKNIFDYQFANGNDNLFYSRRIGRSPQGRVNAATGEYIDRPQNSTILGAAKFSGKTESGLSVGVLETVTAREQATIDNNGSRRKQVVEPLTNYFVGRVQQDFNNRNSFIGGIFTATNRALGDDLGYLVKDAYTAGIDFRHQWRGRQYYIAGNFVTSNVSGSTDAISALQLSQTHRFDRADAGHVSYDPTRTSLTGTGGKLEYGKRGGDSWTYQVGGFWRSPELELNDVGFLRQADDIRTYAGINHKTLQPGSFYRQIESRAAVFTTYDFDGNHNRTQFEFQSSLNWLNNWTTTVGAGHKPRIFINTFLRGGPRWRFSEENFVYVNVNSDRSKKFNFNLGYTYSAAMQKNFAFKRYRAGINYQPIDALSFSLDLGYGDSPNRTQWVTSSNYGDQTRYILGKIDNETFDAALRINYSINPNLSIQYYGSPFYARGIYSDFNYVTSSTAKDINERVAWYSADQISATASDGLIDTYFIDEDGDGVTDYQFGNPDFAFVQFRSNLVMRWEYTPGSELFLVWSQGGENGARGLIDRSIGRRVGDQLFDEDIRNTFLVKYTYRFRR